MSDGPLIPLVVNPSLSLSALVPSLPLIPKNTSPILLTDSILKSFEDIVEESNRSALVRLQCLQLCHFYAKNKTKLNFDIF